MPKKIQPSELIDIRRKIHINNRHLNAEYHYDSNQIHTQRYSILTFFPKALFKQYLRLANVYFLVAAILQIIKTISSINPISAITPVVTVLTFSLVREAYEDHKRHKNDKLANEQLTKVLDTKSKEEDPFKVVKWKDIRVGDIIKVSEGESFPADLLVLNCSEESGICYVETSNLDGERNLKTKQTTYELKEYLKTSSLNTLQGEMLCDLPNNQLYKFKGIMEVNDMDDAIYLTAQNFCLRGTFLRNTPYMVGLVVYTGHDSKIMQNQGGHHVKMSSVEKRVNRLICIIFLILVIMSFVLGILGQIFVRIHTEDLNARAESFEVESGIPLYDYLFYKEGEEWHPVAEGVIYYFAYFLLMQNMIPISLIIAMELSKFFQAAMMEFDDQLANEAENKRCRVFNIMQNEQLAKVEYVFADKTGTLTSNNMEFICCSINGKSWEKKQIDGNPSRPGRKGSIETYNFDDKDALYYREFWTSLAVCHDVVIDVKVNPTDLDSKYQGSSPDEVELVKMAAHVKYEFKGMDMDIMHVNIDGVERKFKLLKRIDFTSDRKRMTVVVQDMESGKITMYIKGADSVILNRVNANNGHAFMDSTKEHLTEFSKKGLRTLCIAKRELLEGQFVDWAKRHEIAVLKEFDIVQELEDGADAAERKIAIEEELETDLMLLGVTALEDKLQEGVPQTIADLYRADIKIWMLTGDKLETAENIGYSSNLIQFDTKIFKIKPGSIEQTKQKMKKIKTKLGFLEDRLTATQIHMNTESDKISATIDHTSVAPFCSTGTALKKYNSFALLIDGDAISYVVENKEISDMFANLIDRFRTVICCRSTPFQKAEMVKFVNKHLHKVTLAIGDGGNDVNMIRTADIGIGIMGKEGNQAAFASDYAVPNFRHLWRVLFVHGRWNYKRICNFIKWHLYKTLIFTFPIFLFAFESGYSGQTYWESWHWAAYNSLITAFIPIFYGTFEQDVNPNETESIKNNMPKLYKMYRKIDLLSYERYFYWFFLAAIQMSFCYYFSNAIYTGPIDNQGNIFGFWERSVSLYTSMFGIGFMTMLVITDYYTLLTLFAYTVGCFFIFYPSAEEIINVIDGDVQGVWRQLTRTPLFWLVQALNIGFAFLVFYVPRVYLKMFYPSLTDTLRVEREMQRRSKRESLPFLNRKYEALQKIILKTNCATWIAKTVFKQRRVLARQPYMNGISIPLPSQVNSISPVSPKQSPVFDA